ncbi:hypothetical protein RG2014_032 [Delftia phage RG-2014]|uniref:Uncharacterized protein n=1 Tax=Delftia phage RG-2014 TaxID=1563661 RepID=A0A097PBD3_9CAUD|nr:hypothetical protein RG2014_032 [Delftia phage RG-2014]AIU44286.1 hypothetical protein RG2014_032 [Delftia phage RG-2014]
MTHLHNLHKRGDAFGQSHAQLLDYVLQFSTARLLPNGARFASSPFQDCSLSDLRKGDLVLTMCHSVHDFRLSWFLGETRENGQEILLKSTRTGEEVWWSSISVARFSKPEEIMDRWRWTNEQHEFNKRWVKACKSVDSFMRPHDPKFDKDTGLVYLGVSYRFGMGPEGGFFDELPREGLDWKALVKQVKAFKAKYEAWCEQRKAHITNQ